VHKKTVDHNSGWKAHFSAAA